MLSFFGIIKPIFLQEWPNFGLNYLFVPAGEIPIGFTWHKEAMSNLKAPSKVHDIRGDYVVKSAHPSDDFGYEFIGNAGVFQGCCKPELLNSGFNECKPPSERIIKLG